MSQEAIWPAKSFLGRLPGEMRNSILSRGHARHYEDGQEAIVEGTESPFVLIVLSGWFKIVATMQTGKEALVAVRAGGDLIGELGVMEDTPRVATVRASGPVDVRVISRLDFRELLAEMSEVAAAVSGVIASRLRVATRRQVEFTTCPSDVRVARILLELMVAHGRPVRGGVMIDVALTQPELAGLSGCTEPTVHRVLTVLRRQKVVETGYKRVVVLNEDELARRAEG
ncbi:Crp/Fnr family transcriptional regulator [Kineosporia babensis]|uniref:Crp/Fnr family transcriptional regulator n=1 Tax=Kineosporia babensis TaxID=499548 RepID=A0A9X1NE27_9ACTN|nr:Crp/Fnr family transcriptional regulator [Kineosporia babensis]MCD5312046.1 Crp/Fnr family transcriptional regulator [Kineosporia babensis]